MCNKMYLVNVGCTLSQAYILTGINANMVRYIEIHFLERAFVASLITGSRLFLTDDCANGRLRIRAGARFLELGVLDA